MHECVNISFDKLAKLLANVKRSRLHVLWKTMRPRSFNIGGKDADV